MRDQLELMIAGDPRIRLRDRVPREELRALFAGAHVCVSPSLWECWPNTVLEAFEQNRPVLATPVGGHLGMVEPGRNGWLAADTERRRPARPDGADHRLAAREPVALSASRGPAAQLRAARRPRAGPRGLPRAEPRRRPRRAPKPVARAGSPPLVSVVVPYHRMERFVEETLASIAAQTLPADRDDRRQRRLAAPRGRGARRARRALPDLGRHPDQLRARPGSQPRHRAQPRPLRAAARPRRPDPAAVRRALPGGARGGVPRSPT